MMLKKKTGGAPATASKRNSKASTRIRRRALRIHGQIARDIGVRIVSGQYKPGELLDGEVVASGQLQVSRGAYREAVRILAAKGLVESRPKVGTRISQPEHWHLLDPDVMAWLFEVDPDDTLLNNLFELRRIVEPRAAALAATRRTDEHLEAMEHALTEMIEHTLSVEAGRQADHDFHSALLRASGNAFMVTLISSIGAAVSWSTVFKQRFNPHSRDPVPDHRRVLDAVRAGDARAAQSAMEDLVDLALSDTNEARKLKRRSA
jgi:DNA-binding FadR family transcriptional regulator